MKELTNYLPEKDKKLALDFIDKRDFESLYDIVKSDIYLVRRNEDLLHPKKEYMNIDIDKLLDLEIQVINYMSYL